jgi:hypothetical protein
LAQRFEMADFRKYDTVALYAFSWIISFMLSNAPANLEM